MGQCRYCRYLDIVTQCHNYRCISSRATLRRRSCTKKPINIWHQPALPSSPPANGLYPYHRVQIAVEAGSWLPLEIIIFIVRPQSIIRIISESALLLGAAAGNGALWASDNCTNSAYRGSGFVVCSCSFRIVCILSFPLLIRWHRFHFRKIPSAECRINFDKQA